MNVFAYVCCASLLLSSTMFGQATPAENPGSSSFDLMVGHNGVSFGNGQTMNGLRFAWRDGNFVRVNGISVSFWIPYNKPSGEVDGISFGFVAPGAKTFRGLSLGLGGIVASESMEGINIGGLGLVSQGGMSGINIGGLGLVSQGATTGINIGGLGSVSQGVQTGFNIGGLGLVSQGALTGVNLAVLGLVGQGNLTGISVGGLGVVSQGALTGCTVAGLGLVSQGPIEGVSIAGLGIVGQSDIAGLNVGGIGLVSQSNLAGVSITMGMARSEGAIAGITFAGYRVKSPEIVGLNISMLWTESTSLTGFTLAGYNRTYGLQQGLVIGVFNHTEDLLGIQIGLLNYVERNPPWARLLPFINANF
jgi:hypothetical protein